MVSNIGAQVALLAFTVTVVVGLAVGNGPETILSRAIAAMFLALLVGQAAGWVARAVLREDLQRQKMELDKLHQDELQAAEEALAKQAASNEDSAGKPQTA